MRGYGMIDVNMPGWLEKEKPVAGPMDAIVRPIAVAPCSSDTHAMHGGSGRIQNRILGHEAVGEVVEVGNLVKNFIQAMLLSFHVVHRTGRKRQCKNAVLTTLTILE